MTQYPNDVGIRCKRCGEHAELSPFRTESLKRFRQFTVLALAIALLGLGLWMLGVALWPGALYVTAAFVVSQAIMKWLESRWMRCPHCNAAYTYFGRIRGAQT